MAENLGSYRVWFILCCNQLCEIEVSGPTDLFADFLGVNTSVM